MANTRQWNSADGYTKVSVNVQPPLQEKRQLKTVKVVADGEYYGLNKVNVDVPQGVFPSGTLDITENGQHNVEEYEKVNVNVVAVDPYLVPLITREITEITNDKITTTGRYAFAYCQKLVTVNLPNITSTDTHSF